MFDIEDERVVKFSELSMRKDVNFKLVLAKNEKLNHDTLRNLLTAFLKRKIYNLQVLSEELKLNSNYDKQQVFDILVGFNEGNKVDVEMQVIDNENDIGKRMAYYLSNIGASQLKRGDTYKDMKEVYILLFLDYIRYEDDDIVHEFGMLTRKGIPFDPHCDYLNIITVEIPKAKYKEQMKDAEIWAYMLQCSGRRNKEYMEHVKFFVDSREEISMLVECVNQISRDEKEWLEQGRQEGKIELILMMANNTTCEEISKITGLDIEYVQSVA